jgi:hypothetical protein
MMTISPLARAILACLEENASRCCDDANDRSALLDALLDKLAPLFEQAYVNGKEDAERGMLLTFSNECDLDSFALVLDRVIVGRWVVRVNGDPMCRIVGVDQDPDAIYLTVQRFDDNDTGPVGEPYNVDAENARIHIY